jgi:hypothetical protein
MKTILGLDLSLMSTGWHSLDVRDKNNHYGGTIAPKEIGRDRTTEFFAAKSR